MRWKNSKKDDNHLFVRRAILCVAAKSCGRSACEYGTPQCMMQLNIFFLYFGYNLDAIVRVLLASRRNVNSRQSKSVGRSVASSFVQPIFFSIVYVCVCVFQLEFFRQFNSFSTSIHHSERFPNGCFCQQRWSFCNNL
jgi:hypothetical protein